MVGSDYDNQQTETTRLEKVLAVALVIFLLIGGFWVLDRLDSIPHRPDWQQVREEYGLPELQEQVRELQAEVNRVAAIESGAREAMNQAETEYEFLREEYRTALDAGVDSPEKKAAYERARERYEEQKREHEASLALLREKRAALEEPQDELMSKEKAVADRLKSLQRRYELILFGLRVSFAIPVFALSVYAWQRLRDRGSRFLIIGTAFVGASGIILAYVAGRYAWGFFEDLAPAFISVVGAGISIAGIVGLRRYLFSFERVSQARMRQGECPYCGFPARREAKFCVSCGERLHVTCAECGEPRPRLALHCPHCGAPGDEVEKND